jgi:hypothetical protein
LHGTYNLRFTSTSGLASIQLALASPLQWSLLSEVLHAAKGSLAIKHGHLRQGLLLDLALGVAAVSISTLPSSVLAGTALACAAAVATAFIMHWVLEAHDHKHPPCQDILHAVLSANLSHSPDGKAGAPMAASIPSSSSMGLQVGDFRHEVADYLLPLELMNAANACLFLRCPQASLMLSMMQLSKISHTFIVCALATGVFGPSALAASTWGLLIWRASSVVALNAVPQAALLHLALLRFAVLVHRQQISMTGIMASACRLELQSGLSG